MGKAKDIRFENEDLFIDPNTGDFAITESDTRHVQDIVESFAGWWKEFPSVGVGINRYLASSASRQRIAREIKLQLTGDGYRVDNIQFDKENFYITGERKDESL